MVIYINQAYTKATVIMVQSSKYTHKKCWAN